MSFPYKRILCPIDFDEFSAQALKEAAALALSSGATLYVFHAVQINPLTSEGAIGGLGAGELYDSQLQLARTQIHQMMSELPKQLTCQVIVQMGEAGPSIIKQESAVGADIVVMATHGRRGLKHLVLGSVAEKIVRESHVPVLTVRPTA
ncbi:MAG TPA: universal stress protein [Candidatus Binataceae bacterium]|nr:universal stress protein [Candidatus Binataceae bacterium]